MSKSWRNSSGSWRKIILQKEFQYVVYHKPISPIVIAKKSSQLHSQKLQFRHDKLHKERLDSISSDYKTIWVKFRYCGKAKKSPSFFKSPVTFRTQLRARSSFLSKLWSFSKSERTLVTFCGILRKLEL